MLDVLYANRFWDQIVKASNLRPNPIAFELLFSWSFYEAIFNTSFTTHLEQISKCGLPHTRTSHPNAVMSRAIA